MEYTDNKTVKKGTFLDGIKASYRALQFVGTHKSLLLYFIIPFFVNAAILSGIFYLSYTSLIPWLEGMLTGNAWYFETLRFLLVPLVMLVTSIFIVLLYSLTGNIITSPFNEFLSGAVEKRLGLSVVEEDFSVGQIFFDMKTIAATLLKLVGLMMAMNVVLFIVNIIPVAGFLMYSVLSFMNTVFFLGLQFLEYPMARRRIEFWKKIKLAWSHKFLVMGVGTSFFLISFIPVIGFLGLNIATIAATIVFSEYMETSIQT